MRKILAVLGIIIISAQSLSAQLIQGLDTICVNTPIQLNSTLQGANSYYWGFCSAYLDNNPQGSSIAAGTGLDAPRSIALAYDSASDNNCIFVVSNGASSRELIRYDFGNTMANSPNAVNLGDFGGVISANPKGLWFEQDGDGWHAFLAAGNGPLNSQIVRFDFGPNLSSVPTVTDLGNLGGLIINPQDMYLFEEAGMWYGFTNSGFTGDLVRMNFGADLSGIPTIVTIPNLGVPPLGLGFPTGFWPAFDGTDWYLFVCNAITSSVVRLDFGPSLTNINPSSTDLGDFGGALTTPRDISIIKDCDTWYGFVTNEGSDNIVRLEFTDTLDGPPTATNLGNFGNFDDPIYLTHFRRTRDNIFAFTANNGSNSISRIEFNTCTVPDVPFSIFETPPPVTYDQPGIYNVYLAINEGLPSMQVECKQITVLPTPLLQIQNDTLLCLGDTILVTANGQGLNSLLWSPTYNMFPPTGDTESVLIYPRENVTYDIEMIFLKGGCVVDTSLTITVSQVTADAGKDVVVGDGAYTILGGPKLSYGSEYSYIWSPAQFLDDPRIANPRVDPLFSRFYTLEVTNDSTGCVARDSVYVFNECVDISLPNAFNPVSNIPKNRKFGIENNQLFSLNYFRIFNRWGNLIFETTLPNVTWDGTFENIPAPSGTYVWIVDGECSNGKRIQKQGNVFLVR